MRDGIKMQQKRLQKNLNKLLTNDQKQMCDAPISLNELSKAVKQLKKNKSPGEDGITAEFYLKFWDMISKEFIQVVKEIEDTQSLCFSLNRGIIILITPNKTVKYRL